MADLLVSIAKQNFNSRPSAKYRIIIKLLSKDMYDKLPITMLPINSYGRLPTNFTDLFPELAYLTIENNWITDEHLIKLKKSLKFIVIDYQNYDITDKGISELNLVVLQQSSYSYSPITEKSVVLNKKLELLTLTSIIDPNVVKELTVLHGIDVSRISSKFAIPTTVDYVSMHKKEIDLQCQTIRYCQSIKTFIIPYEHIDFLSCPRHVHYMLLGITKIIPNRIEFYSSWLKSLKLRKLDITATSESDQTITKEYLIGLLDFFGQINHVFIYLNKKLIYEKHKIDD